MKLKNPIEIDLEKIMENSRYPFTEHPTNVGGTLSKIDYIDNETNDNLGFIEVQKLRGGKITHYVVTTPAYHGGNERAKLSDLNAARIYAVLRIGIINE